MNYMPISEAIEVLSEELEARKEKPDEYAEIITDAIEAVLYYAKRSAPR
jgi:hypothetical protein